ncbi:MAG TPA: hypothetical protein VN175_04175 [Rhizomicrobium sp.]|jgi:hypothetical protein|nr:hypothetical protein [Rhizomicrobium sp.]
MDTDQTKTFRNLLRSLANEWHRGWIYLPSHKNWSLDSECAVLASDEVPPELEDEPDAGIPQFAKQRDLIQVMPVASLQDVVSNAHQQKPLATPDELFAAFKFYCEHDAFIVFDD